MGSTLVVSCGARCTPWTWACCLLRMEVHCVWLSCCNYYFHCLHPKLNTQSAPVEKIWTCSYSKALGPYLQIRVCVCVCLHLCAFVWCECFACTYLFEENGRPRSMLIDLGAFGDPNLTQKELVRLAYRDFKCWKKDEKVQCSQRRFWPGLDALIWCSDCILSWQVYR